MVIRNWFKFAGAALLAVTLIWGVSPLVMQTSVAFAAEEDVSAPVADAANTTDDAPKSKIPTSVWGMIVVSGVFGWTILLFSVVLLALTIQTVIEFKPEKMMNEEVLAEIEAALDNGEYDAGIEICEAEDSFMTRIIGAGLGKMANGFGRMQEALNEEAETQATFLHQRIGYIALIAGTSPMLGLLGTVSGMLGAFKAIALNPTASAQDLAGGIYEALATTLMGLVVAIPATVIFALLRNKVVKITMDMSVINGEILDRFRTEN